MEKLTDEQIDDLMFYMGKPHTISARNQSDRHVAALIAEVREYRRRAVTDGRYDNEAVIAEDERPRAITRAVIAEDERLRAITRAEYLSKRDKIGKPCYHIDHWNCGDGWVYYIDSD